MISSNGETAVRYVLLLTNDESGLTGFPATLLPNGRVLVRDLPVEHLKGICPGEVVIIPAVDSTLPVQRVRPVSTRAQRTTEKSPTVVAVITLARAVADVPLPDSESTSALLDGLSERFDGDLVAGLQSVGSTAVLTPLGAEFVAQDAGAECTEPVVIVGMLNTLTICDVLGIFC
jgi:hypothetical protein